MAEEEDRLRLAEAINAASDYIRESALTVGVAGHVALVAVRRDGDVEAKVVTRESAAMAHPNNELVERFLSRGCEPGLIQVIASDFTKTPGMTLTARLPIVVQRGGDA